MMGEAETLESDSIADDPSYDWIKFEIQNAQWQIDGTKKWYWAIFATLLTVNGGSYYILKSADQNSYNEPLPFLLLIGLWVLNLTMFSLWCQQELYQNKNIQLIQSMRKRLWERAKIRDKLSKIEKWPSAPPKNKNHFQVIIFFALLCLFPVWILACEQMSTLCSLISFSVVSILTVGIVVGIQGYYRRSYNNFSKDINLVDESNESTKN